MNLILGRLTTGYRISGSGRRGHWTATCRQRANRLAGVPTPGPRRPCQRLATRRRTCPAAHATDRGTAG